MRTGLLLITVLSMAIVGACSDRDVVNPIECYRVHRNQRTDVVDSTYIGRIYFPELPSYGKWTELEVTHVCKLETDDGLWVGLAGFEGVSFEGEWPRHIPGRFVPGDTVAIALRCRPERIGHVALALRFYVKDCCSGMFGKSDGFSGDLATTLFINRFGNCQRIAGDPSDYPKVYERAGPLIGASIDTLFFRYTPKWPERPTTDEIREKQRQAATKPGMLRRVAFDVSLRIVPPSDPGGEWQGILVTSPYYNYAAGIALCFRSDGRLFMNEIPRSHVGPVDTALAYEFHFSWKLKGTGDYNLTIACQTMNPFLEFNDDGSMPMSADPLVQTAARLSIHTAGDGRPGYVVKEGQSMVPGWRVVYSEGADQVLLPELLAKY